jgi:cardiolipin synthase A/B
MNFFNKKKTRIFLIVLVLVFAWLFVVGVWHTNKPLPAGLSFEGGEYFFNEEDVSFVRDLTSREGKYILQDHQVFDQVFEMIEGAEEFILIDMFLMGNSREGYRNLSLELSEALIEKKLEKPEIKINFITDEFNIRYWSYDHPELKAMQEAGINVVYTDMTYLRDSNYLFSSVWRTLIQWFGHPDLDCDKSVSDRANICVSSTLRMFNAKANHRKIVIADAVDEDGSKKYVSLFTSANPDDWGSGYSNTGLYFDKAPVALIEEIYESEKSIADFSYGSFEEYSVFDYETSGDASVQFLTEGKVKKNLIKAIDETVQGESIDVVMFLLTEEDVIKAISKAAKRGVEVRVVVDPSSDLFNKKSKGVPNCPAAKDLKCKSDDKVDIRWYNTGNQQFHSKMIVIKKKNGRVILFAGSSNLTRRNLNDLNIEAHVKVNIDSGSQLVADFEKYFELIWNGDETHTVSYENNECSFFSYLKYRFQEKTGFGAF